MIDNVTLWWKLESTWYVYSILLILLQYWTIFKMVSLERLAEKWPLARGGGGGGGGVVRPLRPPLVTGLYILLVLVGTCEYSNENVRWWKASFSHDCDICCFAVMRLERQVRTQQDSWWGASLLCVPKFYRPVLRYCLRRFYLSLRYTGSK